MENLIHTDNSKNNVLEGPFRARLLQASGPGYTHGLIQTASSYNRVSSYIESGYKGSRITDYPYNETQVYNTVISLPTKSANNWIECVMPQKKNKPIYQ